MKRILNLFLIVGALTLLPGFAAAKQSSAPADQPQAVADPQAKESRQVSSPKRHRRARTNLSRRHRRHKTSSKH